MVTGMAEEHEEPVEMEPEGPCTQPPRTQAHLREFAGEQPGGWTLDPAASTEGSATTQEPPLDAPIEDVSVADGGGYIDPSTMSEEQSEAYRELERILATTPFTGTGRIVELMPGFYLSNGSVATNLSLLKKHNISAVLNLAPNEVPTGEELYSEHGISYRGISAKDEHDVDIIADHWAEACHFIEGARQEDKKVLIHCRAGINRSGALAIAYVSWKTSTDLLETARHIKGKRYQLVTNENFQRALVRFSASHGLLRSTSSSKADGLGLTMSSSSSSMMGMSVSATSLSASVSAWGVNSTTELQTTATVETTAPSDL